MTNSVRKRPWFQYHLSTLIVLQFVAAGLLWLNVVPHVERVWSMSGIEHRDLLRWGWPYCFPRIVHRPSEPFGSVPVGWTVVIIDVIVAGMILFGVGVVLERPIRRKEALASQTLNPEPGTRNPEPLLQKPTRRTDVLR